MTRGPASFELLSAFKSKRSVNFIKKIIWFLVFLALMRTTMYIILKMIRPS